MVIFRIQVCHCTMVKMPDYPRKQVSNLDWQQDWAWRWSSPESRSTPAHLKKSWTQRPDDSDDSDDYYNDDATDTDQSLWPGPRRPGSVQAAPCRGRARCRGPRGTPQGSAGCSGSCDLQTSRLQLLQLLFSCQLVLSPCLRVSLHASCRSWHLSA